MRGMGGCSEALEASREVWTRPWRAREAFPGVLISQEFPSTSGALEAGGSFQTSTWDPGVTLPRALEDAPFASFEPPGLRGRERDGSGATPQILEISLP